METITTQSYLGIIATMVLVTVGVGVAAHYLFKFFVRK